MDVARESTGTRQSEAAMTPDAATVASRLQKPKRSGPGWMACCPAHEDSTASLSINDGEKGVVFRCHAGCTQESVLNAIEALGVQIRKTNDNGHHEHREPMPVLTVQSLAAAKWLNQQMMRENCCHDSFRGVGFFYTNQSGGISGTKFRKYLGHGSDGRDFSWEVGSKPCLFGLWRLEKDLANDGRVILCEGETDALTLWQHGYTALGLPGASMWREEWLAQIPESSKVYVILEPDQGGRTVEAAVMKSELRPRAWFIRMTEVVKDPNQLHMASEAGFVDNFDKLIAGAQPAEPKKEPRIVLRHIGEIVADLKETDWLIEDTIEHRIIGLMVGARGSLKSFVALDWMMRMAIENHGVVALSAEGDGLGRRIEAWHKMFAPRVDINSLPMVAMERSISLCVADVRDELAKNINGLQWTPKIITIDTLSKYSAGLDENENSEVRDFLEALSDSLRVTYGCAILLVAHTGYAASDRIRGASSFGANTEAEYIVTRASPLELLCKVSRERFKDSPGLEPIGYAGEVVDLGRQDKRGRQVTSLVLRAGAELPAAKVRGAGANQTATLVALREWVASHPGQEVIPHDELADLLKRQGVNRKRKPEVLNWLVNAGAILPSVGGHKVNGKAIL
jgi:hypothetical protein